MGSAEGVSDESDEGIGVGLLLLLSLGGPDPKSDGFELGLQVASSSAPRTSSSSFPVEATPSSPSMTMDDPTDNPYSSCEDSVVVYDGEAPEIRCPVDSMIQTNLGGACYGSFDGRTQRNKELTVHATDNCGLDDEWDAVKCTMVAGNGEKISLIKQDASLSWRGFSATSQAFVLDPKYEWPVGGSLVECTAMDASKNSASCIFSVYVMDPFGSCS